MRKLAYSLLLSLLLASSINAAEKNVVPQGAAIAVANMFVCRTLDDAKAVIIAIASNDEKRLEEVLVPLQTEGKCGLSRGVVIYQATVYEREDTEFRVLSLQPAGTTATYYEITDWRIHVNMI